MITGGMLGNYGPLLYYVGRKNSLKMFSLFLDCLFHFGEVLLNENKPNNCNIGCYNDYEYKTMDDIVGKHKLFIQKYLNFSLGGKECINEDAFVK